MVPTDKEETDAEFESRLASLQAKLERVTGRMVKVVGWIIVIVFLAAAAFGRDPSPSILFVGLLLSVWAEIVLGKHHVLDKLSELKKRL